MFAPEPARTVRLQTFWTSRPTRCRPVDRSERSVIAGPRGTLCYLMYPPRNGIRIRRGAQLAK